MRSTAVHAWPQLTNAPNAAPAVARPRSASANTSIGSLPPSSSAIGVSVLAARSMTFFPVAVEPVNIRKSTASVSAPPVSPKPGATW
jgi:hypothetical protein